MRANGAAPGSRARAVAGALAALGATAVLVSGCAGRYRPVSAQDESRILAAWREAVGRTSRLVAARLLYEAAVSQGVLRVHGTLAVRVNAEEVDGRLSGEFGAPLARYEKGELTGEKLQSVRIPARELRWLLAGIWGDGDPQLSGFDGSRALLRWKGSDSAEGVFEVAGKRLVRLDVARVDGNLEVRYSGATTLWPEGIDIAERRTGSAMRLRLIAAEPSP